MSAYRFPLLVGVLTCLLTAPAMTQQPVQWAADLTVAQQRAAQANQLILIHFWAPDCAPCLRLDKEVFNQAYFASAVAAHYVPVKVNAKQHPSVAQYFGVDRWPTDVIVTPAGQVVHRMSSPSDGWRYVTQLNAVVTYRKTHPPQVAAATPPAAQQPAPPAAAQPSPFAASPGVAAPYQQPAQPAAAQPRYASQGPALPDLNISVPTAPQNVQPAQMPAAQPPPPTVDNQPAISAGPALTQPAGPNPAQTPRPEDLTVPQQPAQQQPAWSGEQRSQWSTPASPQGESSQWSTAPPAQQAPSQWSGSADPYMPQQPAATPSAPAMTAQVPTGPQVDLTPQSTPPAETPTTPPQPAAPAAPTPAAFGLAKHCPVTLQDGMQWMQGDARWGAVHRGRTYLFASAENQQRFMQDPDRYAPALSGYDPVVFAETGQFVDGKCNFGMKALTHVFLFVDQASLDKFQQDPQRYAQTALQAMRAQAGVAGR